MVEISNVKVYDLEESIVACRNAMRLEPSKIFELTPQDSSDATDVLSYYANRREDWEKSLERAKKLFRELGSILVIGIVYAIWFSFTGIGIPCPIRLVTGYRCPGCGITHCAVNLLHGRVREAYEANQFVFILAPFGLVYGLWKAIRYIRVGNEEISIPETIVFGILFVLAIVFAFYRNIYLI